MSFESNWQKEKHEKSYCTSKREGAPIKTPDILKERKEQIKKTSKEKQTELKNYGKNNSNKS
jgi:hypothetical protein